MFRNIQILLVEDDEVEAESVARSFDKHQFDSPLVYARDGVEALNLLNSDPSFMNPYVILLDMTLPRMNGREFLTTLRQNPHLNSSTVFVVTHSERPEDVNAAYEAGVAGYILKDSTGENHVNLIELLKSYFQITSPFIDYLFNP